MRYEEFKSMAVGDRKISEGLVSTKVNSCLLSEKDKQYLVITHFWANGATDSIILDQDDRFDLLNFLCTKEAME